MQRGEPRMARFDAAAQRLPTHFRYRPRGDFHDMVYAGDTFLQEVRTSGREGERRMLSVHQGEFFVTLTVGPDVPLTDVVGLMRMIAHALEYEHLTGRSTQPL